MNEKKNDALIASIENVQAIQEFLTSWYSINDLFETAANAGAVLLDLSVRCPKVINDDDMKHLQNLINQHVMVANLLKRFDDGVQGAETGGRDNS